MVLILTLALCLSIPFSDNLLKNTSSKATHFQQKCRSSLPSTSNYGEALASLVCGEKITDKDLDQTLKKTSLIHIFVVSGSHLLLLDQVLSILKIPFLLRFLFLSLYALCVGWQAPAVRALLGLGIKWLLRHKYFFFPPDLLVLITGLVTLLFFPKWWGSLSLQMSWCAALALCWAPTLRIQNSWLQAIASQFAIYFFMSAPLWGLGSLHPLGLIYNLFLGPVVSYLLLPLSFLGVIFNPLLFLFDLVMTVFSNTLPLLADPIDLQRGPPPSVRLLWVWISFWHIIFHFLRLHLWQGKDST